MFNTIFKESRSIIQASIPEKMKIIPVTGVKIMNIKNILSLTMVLLFLTFTACPVQAQQSAGKKIKTWSISSWAFISLREGSRNFSLDSEGNLKKQSRSGETTATVDGADLQEIGDLLQALELLRTKTRIVKGAQVYDYPYWDFTITLDGKSYLMEGFSFNDQRFVVLSAKQKEAFLKLKEKLDQIGAKR